MLLDLINPKLVTPCGDHRAAKQEKACRETWRFYFLVYWKARFLKNASICGPVWKYSVLDRGICRVWVAFLLSQVLTFRVKVNQLHGKARPYSTNEFMLRCWKLGCLKAEYMRSCMLMPRLNTTNSLVCAALLAGHVPIIAGSASPGYRYGFTYLSPQQLSYIFHSAVISQRPCADKLVIIVWLIHITSRISCKYKLLIVSNNQ